MKFRYLLTVVAAVMLLGLPACKSHKATVVRAGKTEVAAKKTSDKKTVAKTAPKTPSLNSQESDVDTKIAGALVKEARRWIGTPYRYGQKDRQGTDCSGFVMTVFNDVAGVALPRNSAEQCSYCFEVPRKKLQPGDLVFFSSSARGGKVSHVGLYIGDGKMIHASTSRGVIESALDEKYYASHYHSSGRVQPITVSATGGKNKKKGDSEEIRLAKEGVKTEKSDKKSVEPVTESVTLEQFEAMSSKKSKGDGDKSSAPLGSEKKAEKPKTDNKKSEAPKPETPKVMVNGKPVSVQPAEKTEAKNETAPADSVRQADAIRNEVTKAMKFGK